MLLLQLLRIPTEKLSWNPSYKFWHGAPGHGNAPHHTSQAAWPKNCALAKMAPLKLLSCDTMSGTVTEFIRFKTSSDLISFIHSTRTSPAMSISYLSLHQLHVLPEFNSQLSSLSFSRCLHHIFFLGRLPIKFVPSPYLRSGCQGASSSIRSYADAAWHCWKNSLGLQSTINFIRVSLKYSLKHQFTICLADKKTPKFGKVFWTGKLDPFYLRQLNKWKKRNGTTTYRLFPLSLHCHHSSFGNTGTN